MVFTMKKLDEKKCSVVNILFFHITVILLKLLVV